MKLSELLRDERFQFDITPERYAPFQMCLEKAIPGATIYDFPLASSCPLFMGNERLLGDEHDATAIVDAALPECAKLPRKPGIGFVCQCIDCMAVFGKMSKTEIADVIERIEKQFEAHGLDLSGRPTV